MRVIRAAIGLSILLFVSDITAQCPCDRRRDSLALVSIHSATKGQNWKNKWDLTKPINQWWGVGLNNAGCVAWLDFDGDNNGLWSYNRGGNNLDGTIPPAIGNLCQIGIISFNDNPLLRGSIPSTISNLTNLFLLYFDDCALSGALPPELWTLTQLEDLSLANNPLNISIPPQVGNLQKLNGLNLTKCQIYGTIPPEIGNMAGLKRLFLGQNKLTGAIPHTFKTANLSQFVWDDNLLDSMPDLSKLPFTPSSFHGEPYGVVCDNRFTFDDILPLMAFKNRGELCYAPQDSIFKDTTINATTGSTVNIDLAIDKAITSNTYRWLKNGNNFETSSKNNLILRGVTSCDMGTYTATVSNPNAPDLTLFSRKIRLVVSGATPTKTDNITLTLGQNHTLPNGKIVTQKGVYKDTLKAKSGCDSLIIITNIFVKTDNNIIQEEKPLGLSPNGDGVNDALFFDNIQQFTDREFTVFNRWGQIVFQQKNYDNAWQGTNQNGEQLPEGTYYFTLKLDIAQSVMRVGDVIIVR